MKTPTMKEGLIMRSYNAMEAVNFIFNKCIGIDQKPKSVPHLVVERLSNL